jgi:hypothetical protein
VTRLEVPKLVSEIEKIDREGFGLQHQINDTKGGTNKKRSAAVATFFIHLSQILLSNFLKASSLW